MSDETEEVDDRELVPNDVLASGQLVCPSCGQYSEAVRGIVEGARPKQHDRSLCWTCGEVSIFDRTSLGYWTKRAPTDDERVVIDANDEIRTARAELAKAKRQGRGPSSIGHDAGGAPPPPAPLVVLPAEPVSWEDMRARHGFDAAALHRLEDWAATHVPDRRFGPGSIDLDCGGCETRVRLGPTGQRGIFAYGAKVLCPACVLLAQQVLDERDGS